MEKMQKISDALSRLTYLVSVPFKGFNAELDKREPWEMSSFPEKVIFKIAKKHPKEMILYNQKFLSRIYPDGTRFASTNFDPYFVWAMGCQMAALNYQTFGGPMWLNEAWFSSQGRCGYILKPSWLMNADIAKSIGQAQNLYSCLTVQVLSARQLPKKKDFGGTSTTDPFVAIHIKGHPKDEQTQKTTVIKNNGYNPCWNQEFKFPLVASCTAAICFEIIDADSKWRIAHYALMIECIRGGFRTVPLLDDFENEIPNSNLFCHFKLE